MASNCQSPKMSSGSQLLRVTGDASTHSSPAALTPKAQANLSSNQQPPLSQAVESLRSGPVQLQLRFTAAGRNSSGSEASVGHLNVTKTTMLQKSLENETISDPTKDLFKVLKRHILNLQRFVWSQPSIPGEIQRNIYSEVDDIRTCVVRLYNRVSEERDAARNEVLNYQQQLKESSTGEANDTMDGLGYHGIRRVKQRDHLPGSSSSPCVVGPAADKQLVLRRQSIGTYFDQRAPDATFIKVIVTPPSPELKPTQVVQEDREITNNQNKLGQSTSKNHDRVAAGQPAGKVVKKRASEPALKPREYQPRAPNAAIWLPYNQLPMRFINRLLGQPALERADLAALYPNVHQIVLLFENIKNWTLKYTRETNVVRDGQLQVTAPHMWEYLVEIASVFLGERYGRGVVRLMVDDPRQHPLLAQRLLTDVIIMEIWNERSGWVNLDPQTAHTTGRLHTILRNLDFFGPERYAVFCELAAAVEEATNSPTYIPYRIAQERAHISALQALIGPLIDRHAGGLDYNYANPNPGAPIGVNLSEARDELVMYARDAYNAHLQLAIYMPFEHFVWFPFAGELFCAAQHTAVEGGENLSDSEKEAQGAFIIWSVTPAVGLRDDRGNGASIRASVLVKAEVVIRVPPLGYENNPEVVFEAAAIYDAQRPPMPCTSAAIQPIPGWW